MFRFLLSLLTILLLNFNLSAQDTLALHISKLISKNQLQRDIEKLASDKMEGRETGTLGQKMAAKYIYKQFSSLNIPNRMGNTDSSGYFQNFFVFRPKNSIARIHVNNYELKSNSDISLTGYTNCINKNLELLFIGTAQDSSFINKNFSDKAVLFLTPDLYAGAIKANDIVNYSNAKLVLFCNPFKEEQFKEFAESNKNEIYHKLQLESNADFYINPYDSLKSKLHFNRYKTKMESFKGAISLSAASKMLNVNKRAFRKMLQKGNNNTSRKIHFNFYLPYQALETENVIALLPGKDKKDEFVVISAHYDHIGKIHDKIFNGANDNASGTSAMIELARKFQMASQMGHTTKRSILFIAFTGEEKGLLGSRFFVNNSPISKKKITANLNIDMIGRTDHMHDTTNYLYLIGANHLNPKLKTISDSVNAIGSQLQLDYSYDSPNSFLYRASDQASFVQKNIPSIFYFNGLHKDYHMHTDTAEKLDYSSIKKACELIFLTAWELAN